jgi:PIN domain nuclease of toxin-antitoxin system
VILLDTHAWLWLAIEPDRLSAPATAAIRDALQSGGITIASITLWETAFMMARGRLLSRGTPMATLTELVDRTGVILREITPAVATMATHFPDDFPGDPADRLIAATARTEGIPLITRDARLRASPVVETVW